MGFFALNNKIDHPTTLYGVSVDFLHRNQCQVCPLNRVGGNKHPQMPAHGAKKPLAYLIGEAPGAEEDAKGIPFIGPAGRVLRFRLPENFLPQIRWSNVVRTRPPKNRTPTPVEIECCRPAIVKDIEQTKPSAVFGFGNVPLYWALGQSGITKWNGRRVPVQIGEHRCWYFPMLHPSYVMRSRRFVPRSTKDYGSDTEFAFALDLKRAIASLDDLSEPVVHTRDAVLENIECITGDGGENDLQRIVQFFAECDRHKVVGFDYETNGLRPYSEGAKILTVALSHKGGALAFPLHHSQAGWTPVQLEELQSHFETFLYRARCRKVAHHLAFEMEWSAFFYGKRVLRASRWGDTMSQAYVLDERIGCLSLAFLTLQHFGIDIKTLSKLDGARLDAAPLDDVLRYNAIDAKYHRLLYLEQAATLKREKLAAVYREHNSRTPTVVLTQMKGVPVDQEVVAKFHRRYTRELEKIETEINELPISRKFRRAVGHDFRPSANEDIKKALRLVGVDIVQANEAALIDIDHPIAKLTLRWRKTNKNLSTYVKPIMTGSPHVYPDGLLHPQLSTMRVRTTRTSSDHPNVQNYPKRKTKEVRSQVKGKRNQVVVAFDYGQIQARNVAMESKDPALVKAFWDRYDIHSDWAERITRAYPKWVPGGSKALKDKEVFGKFRNFAKNRFVFPLFFGAQPKTLTRHLGIPENVSAQLSDEFWDEFPSIHGWQNSIIKSYKRTGYVTGLSGYRRHAPISPNEIINAPIQADETLIVLDAMTRLSRIDPDRFQASMEIHDDLTFIWEKPDVDKNSEVVIDAMLKSPFEWINVPLSVEMLVGDDWASVQEVGTFASDMWNGKRS